MKLVYKLVSALLAIAILPVMFFLPLVDVKVTSPLFKEDITYNGSIQSVAAGNFKLNTGNNSVDDILKDLNYKEIWAALGELRAPLIISVSALVLALLLAVAAAIAALLAKKQMLVAAMGGAGLLATLTGLLSFGLVSSPVMSGSFDVLSLLGSKMEALKDLADVLAGLTGKFLSVEVLRLDFAVTMMFALFLAMLVWSGVWYVFEILLDGGRPQRKKKELTPAQRAAKKEKEMKKAK